MIPIALIVTILVIVFRDKLIALIAPLGWQDADGFHHGMPGPTHGDPSRDSRRGDHSNHDGDIAL